MRIAVDLQAAQVPGQDPELRLAVLAFALAIWRHRGEHEVTFVLSGAFPASIDAIRATCGAAIPRDRIRVWTSFDPPTTGQPVPGARRDVDALLRSAFLTGLAPDVVHVCAGPVDDAGDFVDVDVPVTATLHAPRGPGTPSPSRFGRAASVVVRPEAGSAGSAVWDEVARATWSTWTRLSARVAGELRTAPARRLRLALVTPLPPAKTGIADHAAELIPALAAHYDLDLVVDPSATGPETLAFGCPIRDPAWLRAHAASVDRVLYLLGNSPFHAFMLPLLDDVPGVVDLHDVYLSGLMAWVEAHKPEGRAWSLALVEGHGYAAARDRTTDSESAMWRYPVHARVTANAVGSIVHSEHAHHLLTGDGFAPPHVHIASLARAARDLPPRAAAREVLALPDDAFVVASFGFLGPTKMVDRLVRAFSRSSLADDPKAYLTFVGEDPGGELRRALPDGPSRRRIRLTGYVTAEEYARHLAATDVAVQLRTRSRGESSRSVLDVMAAGLPAIVNANGAMAEIPRGAVWMLDDDFDDRALIAALEALRASPEPRGALGAVAAAYVAAHHRVDACAVTYAAAIEASYRHHVHLPALIDRIAAALPPSVAAPDLAALARALDRNHPPHRVRHLYLDVTETLRAGRATGIERVALSWARELLASPPPGFHVHPVRLAWEQGAWVYRHARRFAFECLRTPPLPMRDDPIAPTAGDVLLGLDYSGLALVGAERAGLLAAYRRHGVRVLFTVFDLLPITLPEAFPPGADAPFRAWLDAVATVDGAICISQSTADDLRGYLQRRNALRPEYRIDVCRLGADVAIERSAPRRTLRPWWRRRRILTFLMVGTVEPRKGHAQVLDAFEILWRDGFDAELLIVGREGWTDVPYELRRDLPDVVRRLRSPSPHRSWLEEVSDEVLDAAYRSSNCLIAASTGEGFGLPLVEAARHGLPILARDLRIFREVLGDHATYFQADAPADLAKAIGAWAAAYRSGTHPTPRASPWWTWRESAGRLRALLTDEHRTG